MLLSRGGTLRLDEMVSGYKPPPAIAATAEIEEVAPVIPEIEWRRRERDNVRAALQRTRGRVYGPNGAAAMLGVKPTTLISRIKTLGLRTPG